MVRIALIIIPVQQSSHLVVNIIHLLLPPLIPASKGRDKLWAIIEFATESFLDQNLGSGGLVPE
jgi:hypothetical protein